MNIGDIGEISVTGKLIRIEEDVWTKNRLLFTFRVGEGTLSYTVTAAEDVIVKKEV